jgi:hypothetical protein
MIIYVIIVLKNVLYNLKFLFLIKSEKRELITNTISTSFSSRTKKTSVLTRTFARAVEKLIVTCVAMGRRGP